jgi:uncharacterized membrane protein YhhN
VLPWIVLTAVALAGLLVAEWRGSSRGIYLCKPLASTGFLAAALAAGALGSVYGRVILAGLLLSWLGDFFLISDQPGSFLAGLGSFLMAHLAFGAAFALRGQALPWTAAVLVLLAVVAWRVARWLGPHLTGSLRVPVHIYMAVITGMLTLAAGTVAGGSPWITLPGAFAFYLSDLSVANDRFVYPSVVNKLWGLPLYYAAQLCLAASIRG